MKGYWVNHVIEIKDQEKFAAYASASEPMFKGDNKYGATMKVFGPVEATLKGDAVSHAALVEFDSVQAAIDFWDDPDYAATRALLGPLEDSPPQLSGECVASRQNKLQCQEDSGFG